MLNAEQAYEILGLSYGASKEEIRQAYLDLVKIWHPDRFQHDSRLQKKTQEKLKQINEAHDLLKKKTPVYHYKDPYPHRKTYPQKPSYKTYEYTSTARKHASHRPEARHGHGGRRKSSGYPSIEQGLGLFFLFCLFTGLLVVLFNGNLQESSALPAGFLEEMLKPLDPQPWDAGKNSPAFNPAEAMENHADNGYFTVGSTKDEVIAVQGTPDGLDDHEFRYGFSSVFFKNGKVLRWHDYPASSLRAKTIPQPDGTSSFFTVDSTKEEVIAVQGRPDEWGEMKFGYGPSSVWFRDGKVAQWKSFPASPLKIGIIPKSAKQREHFTLGSTRDEVAAVQGTPDEFSEKKFSYGRSDIYFEKGRVAGWRSHPDSPLKAKLFALARKTKDHFTVGSTKDEVIAAQGTPDELARDRFGYGLSNIYFKNGKVCRWQIDSSAPLKAWIAGADSKKKGYFTIGSTKSEVIAVQGTPDELNDAKFSYGLSHVYFENGKVKSWQIYSSSPLKVKLRSLAGD